MTETTNLRTLLLPELEAEFAKTRKMIDQLPDGQGEFKAHEKSMSLARLAGHTADMPAFITMILTTPEIDLSTANMKPLLYTTKPQLMAEFNERADAAITALKNTSDQTFEQTWSVGLKGKDIFKGTRYMAYRDMGVNHLVHHRAQLGVYLRLLNAHVPGTFGPSADEPFSL